MPEMTLLNSILQRQLVPSPLRKAFPVDFALESFCCHKDDEHFLQRGETDVPPFACRFNKTALGGHMVGIADEDGWVQILDTRKKGRRSIIKEWNAHENAVFDIAWTEGDQMLVTASGDQTIRLWDVARDDCLALFKGHSCSVKSVDFREDDIFVFATGARDGNVMVWDMRCNRRAGHFNEPVNIITNAHAEKTPGTPKTAKNKTRRSSSSKPVLTTGQQSVTSVLFQGGEKLISSGAMDGQIKIWDLRKTYTNLKHDPVPFHVFPYPGKGLRKHGFSSLVLDSSHSCLFASCTNDNIYMYSCTALGQKPLGIFSGHLNSTFYVKAALSPNDMYLVSGSSDNNAYIWRVSDPGAPPILMKGHLGEVTSVTWCPSDQGKLVTCSDDNSFRIWRIDLQEGTNEKLNFVVESSSGSFPNFCQPTDGKESPSQLQNRTSSSSPSQSPVSKTYLWTPPTKVNTNPQLNTLFTPIAMATRNTESSNRTPLEMQNILTTSPMVCNAPILKSGSSTQDCRNKIFSPFPIRSSHPLSHRNPVTQATSPRTTTVPKFQSPTQLMTSWLRTNSRKRTHSDRDDRRDNLNQEMKSGVMLKEANGKVLTENTYENQEHMHARNTVLHAPQHNKRKKHGTRDKKENYFSEQKSPAMSPLRKRLCTNDPFYSMTNNSQGHKLRPKKENHIGEIKQGESDCSQAIQATTSQVSSGAQSENWLMDQSASHKAKYGHKRFQPPVRENENKSYETLTAANDFRADGSSSSGTQHATQQVQVL